MADNALVTPQVFSLPSSMNRRAADNQQLQPQALPCTVVSVDKEFVTVNIDVKSTFTFPQITIPQAFSPYIRVPTQVGDKGWAIPGQYYMGGVSGAGGGDANLYLRGNMTTLVFQHVSQTGFTTRDLNAAFINGPNGVVLQDTSGQCIFTLTPSGIVITVGGNTVTINASGVNVSAGTIVNQGKDVGYAHEHSGVVPGGGNTGGPV